MRYSHEVCTDEMNEECSKLGHKDIGRDYEKTMQCVNNSFIDGNYSNENPLLKSEYAAWRNYGSAFWPAVVINDRTYRGDMIPDNVLEAICATFTNPPEYC